MSGITNSNKIAILQRQQDYLERTYTDLMFPCNAKGFLNK